MLPDSSFYTFIDQERKFAIYFLEGQKLIHDFVLQQGLTTSVFPYFRSAILSIQLLLGQLKNGEYFGFYVDAEEPYFRLKIEMNALGLIRGVFYPEEMPTTTWQEISGIVRLVKFIPSAETPYQSTIDLQNVALSQIVNEVLERSFQINSRMIISTHSDQSVMIHQLPLFAKEEPSDLHQAVTEFSTPLEEIMSQGLSDKQEIVDAFAEKGLKYLLARKVAFQCDCSQEQMVKNLKTWAQHHPEEVFAVGESSIEVTCEYCKAKYTITKRELDSFEVS